MLGGIVCIILGRLEASAELESLGRKHRIAWDDLCAAVKCSAKPSTAGLNRPVGETGVEEGDLIHTLLLRQVQPQVSLKYH